MFIKLHFKPNVIGYLKKKIILYLKETITFFIFKQLLYFRKKADEELGIVVECHTLGTHLVTEVNVINPSARIQTGDEIVQVDR